MDEVDVGIVQLLEQDGRMSNVEMAKRLKVSEATIRQRLKRLVGGRVMRMQPMLNAERFGEWHLVLVGLSIEGRQLEQCARQLTDLPEVVNTMIVTGRFDLIATLLLENQRSLKDFITKKLARVPGIRNSETFICLKKSDPWVDAACLVRKR
ncbi:MAG: Lrp/AsnC family transcriptional regulator [Planctomycetes bacterium]|nr:Lrp/AsnC family transcriptional regulator [Planctomycetota bacterium]